MIVRIPSEGQWKLSGSDVDALDRLDDQMAATIDVRDERGFDAVLDEMLAYVRMHGRQLDSEELRESDVILPAPDATISEVEGLFAKDGLIAG